jgi:hypothetical protein
MSAVRCFHLPFPDDMHHVDTGQYDAGAPNVLATGCGFSEAAKFVCEPHQEWIW